MTASCILGLGGTRLDADERAFFAEADPLGFILFARNLATPAQARELVGSLRATVGRPDAPILIDQEGGRVARLAPPHWRKAPPAAAFGALFRVDPDAAMRAAYLNARLLGDELCEIGISVDCAPVLDIPVEGADPVIGDRALSRDAHAVASLGKAFCEGLIDAGVLPVIKHIPGHGRAGADSHESLPRVATDLEELARTDLVPFVALAGHEPRPWAMTAHVVYETVDSHLPATLSRRVIDRVIRDRIGFDGVLISDDLSMKALSGPMEERARAAKAAGCDLVLHCNGTLAEMVDVAAGADRVSDGTAARLRESLGAIGVASAFDRPRAERELEDILGRIDGTAA